MATANEADKKQKGLTKEEINAMEEYLKEKNLKANSEGAVLAAIAKMKEPDRSMAKRIHSIVKASAPDLSPRTWYGMPAYAKGDKVICFFQAAGKFKARYGTLGFSDNANLDQGNMWPASYAVMKLTPEEEKRIADLVKRAVS
jgi:uncharacterized protein YdhG (YjbR/CyaY superfamily)